MCWDTRQHLAYKYRNYNHMVLITGMAAKLPTPSCDRVSQLSPGVSYLISHNPSLVLSFCGQDGGKDGGSRGSIKLLFDPFFLPFSKPFALVF